LGTSVLASVVVGDVTWSLYKGVGTKQDYLYFEKRVSEVQSFAGRTKDVGVQEAHDELSGEKRRLFSELMSSLLHLYRNFASYMVKTLQQVDVSTIYLGYPFNIASDEDNEFTPNSCSCRRPMQVVESKTQEYSVRAFEVVDYKASRYRDFNGAKANRRSIGASNYPFAHILRST